MSFQLDGPEVPPHPQPGQIPVAAYMTGYTAPSILEIRTPPGTKALPKIIRIDKVIYEGPEFDLKPLYAALEDLRINMVRKSDLLELTRQIGNELVGESYLRWDSRVQYYPTLVMIFLETEDHYRERFALDKTIVQRKIQVKARVTDFENEELDEKNQILLIEEYEKRAGSFESFVFVSGGTRCNYIQEGKCRWKTTIFALNPGEAVKVLKMVCSLVKAPFRLENLSVTQSNRENSLSAPCPVQLHKMTLLLNGDRSPHILFISGGR
jgi:hypothetical protein